MKAFLIIVISSFLFITTTKAQTIYINQTINTWYVNAPVSGCDGIWAINKNLWPCAMGCTYAAASPMGCLTSFFPTCDSIIGDTLFLKLCSLPCNLVANCDTNVAICGTGTPVNVTGIDEYKKRYNVKLFPNPSDGSISLECNLQNNDSGTLIIYNLLGDIVGSYNIIESSKNMIVNARSLQAGIYEYEVIINKIGVKKEKLIIIK